jgi:hypothetical protein
MESTRAKEDAVKRETAERLEAFRRLQEDTEKASRGDAPEASTQSEADTWAFNARKRKRTREKEAIAGLKLRKSSSSMAQMTSDAGAAEAADDKNPSPSSPAPTPANQSAKSVQPPVAAIDKAISEKIDKTPATAAASTAPAPAAALGLAAYSSDDDED